MEDGTSAALGSEKVTEQWIPVCGLVRDVLDRIGDKWSLLVINLLSGRTMRFMDIRRAVLRHAGNQRRTTVSLGDWLPPAASTVTSTAFGGPASTEFSAIRRTVPSAPGNNVPSEVH